MSCSLVKRAEISPLIFSFLSGQHFSVPAFHSPRYNSLLAVILVSFKRMESRRRFKHFSQSILYLLLLSSSLLGLCHPLSPDQPDGRLHQEPADQEEQEAGQTEGEAVVLERNHQAETDPHQPAQVTHQSVSSSNSASLSDRKKNLHGGKTKGNSLFLRLLLDLLRSKVKEYPWMNECLNQSVVHEVIIKITRCSG